MPTIQSLFNAIESLKSHLHQAEGEYGDGDYESAANCLCALSHDARLLARQADELGASLESASKK